MAMFGRQLGAADEIGCSWLDFQLSYFVDFCRRPSTEHLAILLGCLCRYRALNVGTGLKAVPGRPGPRQPSDPGHVPYGNFSPITLNEVPRIQLSRGRTAHAKVGIPLKINKFVREVWNGSRTAQICELALTRFETEGLGTDWAVARE